MAVVAEEDQWRNHGEAWVEGVLSLTEAQGDLKQKENIMCIPSDVQQLR